MRIRSRSGALISESSFMTMRLRSLVAVSSGQDQVFTVEREAVEGLSWRRIEGWGVGGDCETG